MQFRSSGSFARIGVRMVVAVLLAAATMGTASPSDPPRDPQPDSQPDSQASFAPGGSPTPKYPDILRAAALTGEVVIQLVVDSSGKTLDGSVRFVRKAHDLFEANVREVLPGLRFTPARVDGRNVRQLVQIVYRFGFVGDSMPVLAPSPTLRTLEVVVRVRRTG